MASKVYNILSYDPIAKNIKITPNTIRPGLANENIKEIVAATRNIQIITLYKFIRFWEPNYYTN